MDAAGRLLVDLAYEDTWYPLTDGQGHSLEVFDPLGDPALQGRPDFWLASEIVGGTPGSTPGLSVRGRRRVGDSNGDSNGDGNGDGSVDLSDASSMLLRLYEIPDMPLPCDGDIAAEGNRTLLDVNDDQAFDLSDAFFLLDYIFLGGAPPPAGSGYVSLLDHAHRCLGGA